MTFIAFFLLPIAIVLQSKQQIIQCQRKALFYHFYFPLSFLIFHLESVLESHLCSGKNGYLRLLVFKLDHYFYTSLNLLCQEILILSEQARKLVISQWISSALTGDKKVSAKIHFHCYRL